MSSLEKLEHFARLLHDVERVTRVARRPDEHAQTNTAEHAFELAMHCWCLMTVERLDLDHERVLKYALAHDIVEVYAGDTFAYDEEAKKTKDAREAKALQRIEKEYAEFPELVAAIHEYHARNTPEAAFVYAVDKLVDPLNISMETKQSMWKEYDISFDTLVTNK